MHLAEELASSHELSGFGNSLFKIKRPDTGEVVAFIGQQEGHEKVYFPKVQPVEIVVAVGELLDKKKMRRAMEKQDYEKAQCFADKKFAGVR